MSKKELPKVSFVIPTLNAENFLLSCLHSIRKQHYPQNKIEILVIDGGSTDRTLEIAKKYNAVILHNPEVFQEPGKTIGTRKAKGEIVFYVDADNILVTPEWINLMITPYVADKNVTGFIPRITPDPSSHLIDQYFGHLSADPFTWFVYGKYCNPKYYESSYIPVKSTKKYILFKFPENNLPLFGFAQGVGIIKKLGQGSGGFSDDMLSGIYAMKHGKLIAYVPQAELYHHHITSLTEYVRKYTWRVKNNLKQQYNGVGIVHRKKYLSKSRNLRMYFFVPYGLSIIFPFIGAIKLTVENKTLIMFLHIPLTFIMACIIIKETILYIINPNRKPGNYE